MTYYDTHLSAERLRAVYELASPRVQQYLAAEIDFVLARVRPNDTVLELGCGHGRVALELARAAGSVVGIDTSEESVAMARDLAGPASRCRFIQMDAVDLVFEDGAFDVVACVQNGICAFGVDRLRLVREALRVTRPGGLALFSSYSSRFWPERLAWFEAQAAAGLLGEIDDEATGDGTIVCRDGFSAGALAPEDFEELGAAVGLAPRITEVDRSSLFAEWRTPEA